MASMYPSTTTAVPVSRMDGFGQRKRVEGPSLGEQRSLGAVRVLGHRPIDGPSAKCDDVADAVPDGEHQSVGKWRERVPFMPLHDAGACEAVLVNSRVPNTT